MGGEEVGRNVFFAKPADERGGVAVGNKYFFGAGGGDGGEQAVPVGVVGNDKSTVEGTAAARAAQSHPAGGKASGDFPEPPQPGRIAGGGRREDQGAGLDF